MKRKPVKSSNLASVGYSIKSKTLEVAFLPPKPGMTQAVYQYKNVPRTVAGELMRADSKGAYLAKKVKGKYDTERVE